MRFSTLGVAAMLGLGGAVSAQSSNSSSSGSGGSTSSLDALMDPKTIAMINQVAEQVPSCALSCMMEVIPSSGCALTDFDCICTNAELTANMVVCLQQSCSVRDQLKTQKYQTSTCGVKGRDLSTHVYSITWALYGVAVLFVIGRMAGRMPGLSLDKSWDDMTMVACLLGLSASSAIAHLMVKNGLGKDIWLLSGEQITNVLFYFYIQQFLYTFLVVFTKISILLLYLRIFPDKIARIACYVIIVITALFGISCFISTGVSCRPVQYQWLQWDGEHHGECFSVAKQTYGLAGVNMALDIIIFILPIAPLWKLKMSAKKRIAVIVMFMVGFFVTITSIIRLKTIASWGLSLNPTYDYTELAVWSLVEMDVGVMCASMPGVAALFRRMFPGLFGGSSNGSGTPGKYSGGSHEVRTFGSSQRGNTPHKLISKTTDINIQYHDYMSSRNSDGSNSRTDKVSIDDTLELVERQPVQVAEEEPTNYQPPSLPPVRNGYRWGPDRAEYRSKW